MDRRPYIAGNWKMNLTPQEGRALAEQVRQGLEGFKGAEVALCPSFVTLSAVREVVAGTPIKLGAQNVHWEGAGAYTGEVSTGMLLAAGCQTVIIGHSERRQYFGETDQTVNKRLLAARTAGLEVIVCVGETLGEREKGATEAVVQRQLEGAFSGVAPAALGGVTLAYEPVWAIGTGKTATPAQAQEVHAFIRGWLGRRFDAGAAGALRIQYGGSVKKENAAELLSQPDIDGALVGGASLKAGDFLGIVKAAG